MTRRAVADTACRIAVQAVQKYGWVVSLSQTIALAPAGGPGSARQSGAGCIERENTGTVWGSLPGLLLTIGREALAENHPRELHAGEPGL